MYGEGELRAHVAQAWAICQELELDEFFNPSVSYASLGVSDVKTLTYRDEYTKYIGEGLYDIMLRDRSILQFKFDLEDARSTMSFAFYESPFQILDIDTYVAETFGISLEEASELTGAFDDDYARYVESETTLRADVMPIRYDYSPALYKAGVHPASHVHFGRGNNLRLATGKLMRPSSFMCLVARQCYPDAWDQFLGGRLETAQEHCHQVHERLEEVPREYWHVEDFLETGFDVPRHHARSAVRHAARAKAR
jgi:hypothetical protein